MATAAQAVVIERADADAGTENGTEKGIHGSTNVRRACFGFN
jgi:hypothetical protein